MLNLGEDWIRDDFFFVAIPHELDVWMVFCVVQDGILGQPVEGLLHDMFSSPFRVQLTAWKNIGQYLIEGILKCLSLDEALKICHAVKLLAFAHVFIIA